jgi:abortive infection bacteriophage resistance protein
LRILVLEAVERIEIAVRMRIGYVLGRRAAFAHEDPTYFVETFSAEIIDDGHPSPSKHVQWLQR